MVNGGWSARKPKEEVKGQKVKVKKI